jgi:3'(2'), 5'-bisphosphate nucleotidase
MRHYGESTHRTKDDSSPVTAADLASNRLIIEEIRRAFPGEPILSEESKDTRERLGARRLWVIDPLDGTKEFLAQNGEFAVMIGFVEDGVAVAGAVYLPARDVCYAAAEGLGCWAEAADGSRRQLYCARGDLDALRLVGSRSHPDALLMRMQKALGITDVQPSGSVGVKCALIAEGKRDLYVHPVPYLSEWDTCAPEVLVREAGGGVTDCMGERLHYNKETPTQPHGIMACGEGVRERVLERIVPLYAAAEGRAG